MSTTVTDWLSQSVRRRSLPWVACWSLLGLGFHNPLLSDDRPNVVFIISDDQHFGDFGFMGHPHVQTPHLDELAARAACFTHGYVPSSVCRPSLMTLLTGLYPHQHGVHFNHPPPGFSRLTRSPEIDKQQYDQLRTRATHFVRERATLPRLLASRGYRCLQTGKHWEGHWRNAGFTEGMTVAEPSTEVGALGNKRLANGQIAAHGNGDHGLAIGRQTMQPICHFIDDCTRNGDPFLVWYAPFLPHLPHNAPQRFQELYEEHPQIPEHRRAYFAACTWFDATVGGLLEHLRKSNLAGNTLIVFVVDNGFVPDAALPMSDGYYNYTHRSKRSPFEAGLRTPLLFYWQGHTQAVRHPQICSSVDIVPTILEALDLADTQTELPGRSLWPAASRGLPLEDKPVFGAIYPGDASVLGHPERDVAYRWIRRGRFKLVVPHLGSDDRVWGAYLDETALFDLESDPDERTNLAGRPELAATLRQLNTQLNDWWSGGPTRGRDAVRD